MVAVAPESLIALQRFGLGAWPGDLDAIESDPRGAVLAEIDPAAVLLDDAALPDTATALTTFRTIQMDRKAGKQAASQQPAPDAEKQPMDDATPARRASHASDRPMPAIP